MDNARRWTRRTTLAAVLTAVLVLAAAAIVGDAAGLWADTKRKDAGRSNLAGPSGFHPADVFQSGGAASTDARPSSSASNGPAAGPGATASSGGAKPTTPAANRTTATPAATKVCSDYVSMSFTRSSGSGSTPANLKVRACMDRHGRLTDGADYVWGSGDWLSGTTGNYSDTMGLKVYSCSGALLLDKSSGGTGSGPAVSPKGDLSSYGLATGTSANYKAELTVKFTITDSGGTAWSGSTVVVTSPCFTPS